MFAHNVFCIAKIVKNSTFMSGCVLKRRSIASSAAIVFPLPVGAPNRTLLSE